MVGDWSSKIHAVSTARTLEKRDSSRPNLQEANSYPRNKFRRCDATLNVTTIQIVFALTNPLPLRIFLYFFISFFQLALFLRACWNDAFIVTGGSSSSSRWSLPVILLVLTRLNSFLASSTLLDVSCDQNAREERKKKENKSPIKRVTHRKKKTSLFLTLGVSNARATWS